MNQYEKDLSEISKIEDGLNRLVNTLQVGVYDQEFHSRITRDAKALKLEILKNDYYTDEEKRIMSLLINYYFEIALLEIRQWLSTISN